MRGHDRPLGQLHASAEDRAVKKIYFGRGRNRYVFRTPAARYLHHVVCIQLCGTDNTVIIDLDRAVAHRMDVLRHAAAAYDQPSAVRQYRRACQTAVRNDHASHRRNHRPARHSAVSYRLASRCDDCIQAEAALRHEDFSQHRFHISSVIPDSAILPVQLRVLDRSAAGHVHRALFHHGIKRGSAAGDEQPAAFIESSPVCLSSILQMHIRVQIRIDGGSAYCDFPGDLRGSDRHSANRSS